MKVLHHEIKNYRNIENLSFTPHEGVNVIYGEKDAIHYGVPYIYDFIGDIKYKIHYKSFYQVNPYTTKLLYEKALEAKQKRIEICVALMESGVIIVDPDNTYIDEGVKIGNGTVISPNCHIKGETVIGENCQIGPNSIIEDTTIGNETTILSSVVCKSKIGNKTSVGPFAYIRPNCEIGNEIKVGDFVEVKNSKIADGTKISHLTYVGDSDVGSKVNFGCGTVTVNYDGVNKHRTVIGDNVFIGCNANLVAPVTINDHSFIAAGSTITDDVESDALAIARARQVVKSGWYK